MRSMIKIRRGVFETNSSSVHAMVICSKENFKKLENGELYIDTWRDKIATREEVIKEVFKYVPEENLRAMDEDEFRRVIRDNGFDTYDHWGRDFNRFNEEYTTEHGDEIVVFGNYGYDG